MHLAIGIVEDPGCLREIYQVDVLPYEFWNDLADVMYLRKCLEEGNHLEQAPVVGVVVPREDGHGVLVVEVVSIG